MNYLLIGPEQYLKFQFLERLKKSTLRLRSGLTAESRTLDFNAFEAGEKEFAGILDALRTNPFMSKRRLVIIKDIDEFREGDRKSIIKYLRLPKESTTLVLESSSGEFDKFLRAVAGFAKTVRCDKLRKKEVDLWIKKEFSIRKKHISLSCATLIRDIAGGDLFLLKNEIEKIVSFAGYASEISERHIEACLGEASYKTAFELVDLVLDKRIDKVLRSLDILLIKGKPHGILNLLAWQFRNFIKIKNLPDGLPPEGVSLALAINPRFARKILEQEKRFTRQGLEKNLEIILEADLFMKRGKLDPRHALERALAAFLR